MWINLWLKMTNNLALQLFEVLGGFSFHESNELIRLLVVLNLSHDSLSATQFIFSPVLPIWPVIIHIPYGE